MSEGENIEEAVKEAAVKKSFASAAQDEDIPDVSDEIELLNKNLKIKIKSLADRKEKTIVPTIFPGLNRATRVGGLPMASIMLVHGPSSEGKTVFVLGQAVSFQRQGHYVYYADAEWTLEKKFAEELGVDIDQLQLIEPDNYEETAMEIERVIRNFKSMRMKGKISKNRCLLFIIDSITKLVPKSEMAKIKEVGKAYPLNAILNTRWLDRLTPLIGIDPVFFIMIAHEKVKLDAEQWDDKFTIKGGKALYFDSTLVCRIDERKKIKIDNPNGKKRIEIGTIHRGVIRKNKVGICNEEFSFVVSNGKGRADIGFDIPRMVIDEATLRGKDSPLSRGVGAVWKHDMLPDGQIKGDDNLLDELREDEDLLNDIIEDLNETAVDAVIEVDDG
ncbi:MAG: hypothetical protein KAS32_19925 [Candidatus Peribacteraceae bacterium]|nr:hypothetical protein [Candidatus Peribacteraceae bacterium]